MDQKASSKIISIAERQLTRKIKRLVKECGYLSTSMFTKREKKIIVAE